MRTNPLFDFSHLTAAERIQHAQDLWDSVEPADIDAELPLTDDQTAELDRRLADLEQNPEAGVPWEQVRADVEASLKQRRQGGRGA